MDGKEAIIKKIIDDANEKGEAIIKKATDAKQEAINEAKAWVESYSEAQSAQTKKEAESIIEKREVSAKMDVQKMMLQGKRNVIDNVFELVIKKLCSMPKEEYVKYLEALIDRHAQEGDSVVLSNKAPITEEEFKNTQAYKKYKLNFLGLGEFEGGIKLSNSNFDTDLSFSSIIEDSKADLEIGVAENLFN